MMPISMSVPIKAELPSLALLAGGLATRMRPVTETIPKAMIEVAGEPFIAHQLRLIACKGVKQVVICCGFLGEQIVDFVGDGSRFGCSVNYSFDGDTLLGTGGALAKALPLLGDEFLVMYGDSWLDADFAEVYSAFQRSGLPALMTVYRNEGRWDTSNVEFVDGVIRRYDKINRTPEMRHIDYGLGVVEAVVFADQPGGVSFDLAELFARLLARGKLAGHEVFERFYEIGSPAGLVETGARLEQTQRKVSP